MKQSEQDRIYEKFRRDVIYEDMRRDVERV